MNIIKVDDLNRLYLDKKFEDNIEYSIIYIGSSNCSYCNDPRLKQYVSLAVDSLNARFTTAELNFSSIGISNDKNILDGFNHLIDIHVFDEISTGKNWNNTGLNRYTDFFTAELATPQVLIVKRIYNQYQLLDDITYHGIESEEIILRLVGYYSIEGWKETNFSLPLSVL